MMPGPDRHAFVVQDGADVVRMHPLDLETDDAGAFLRPEQPDEAEIAQRRAAFGDESGLMRVDALDSDALDPVDRGGEPDPPTICGVPASNRCGGGMKVVRSKLT